MNMPNQDLCITFCMQLNLLKACEEGNFDTAMELLMELMDDETNFDFSQVK